MRRFKRRALCVPPVVGVLLVGLFSSVALSSPDFIPPSSPTALVATAAGCGQVNLSWSAAADEEGGTGLKGYIISRNDPGAPLRQVVEVSIGADRTTFSDANYVRSSATLTYSVVAEDYVGNRSLASNLYTVMTPGCPNSASQQAVDAAAAQPFGRMIASYGPRTAFIYTKSSRASVGRDAWLAVHDEDTGLSSRFMLRAESSYRQVEVDYLLASDTELWTLSHDSNVGGRVTVSQYRLEGAPIPTSATLLSTQPMGGNASVAKAMIRLTSGALVVSWNDDFTQGGGNSWFQGGNGWIYSGFAYRSPSGGWISQYPLILFSSDGRGSSVSVALAQHPSDGAIWLFAKRIAAREIMAVRFSEAFGSVSFDSKWPDLINATHGSNAPPEEFTNLLASPDPSRNAILLAYQNSDQWFVYDDPRGASGTPLKEASITIAAIGADSSTTFIPFPDYTASNAQFGFAALPDGTLSVAYQPIKGNTFTWNEVYAQSYRDNSWSGAVFVGHRYGDYSVHDGGHGDSDFLISGTIRGEVAFQTPELQIQEFALSSSAPALPDTTAPTTATVDPAADDVVAGTIMVTASASDNVEVTETFTPQVPEEPAPPVSAPEPEQLTQPAPPAWQPTPAPEEQTPSPTPQAPDPGQQTQEPAPQVSTPEPEQLTQSAPPVWQPTPALEQPTPSPTPQAPDPGQQAQEPAPQVSTPEPEQPTPPAPPVWNPWPSPNQGQQTQSPTPQAPEQTQEPAPQISNPWQPSPDSGQQTLNPPVQDPRVFVAPNSFVTIDIAASDDIGVTKVEIYVNGMLVTSFENGPYVYSWKVPITFETNVIQAVACDASEKCTTATLMVYSM